MTARPCARCGDIIDTGSHCTDCQPRNKSNRDHAAYLNHARWKRFSQRLRRAAPWCEQCGTTERLTVDHLIPVTDAPELTYTEENCRILCVRCNGRRGATYTAADAGAVCAALTATLARHPTRSVREALKVAQRAAERPGGGP